MSGFMTRFMKSILFGLIVITALMITPSAGRAEGNRLYLYATKYTGGTLVNLDWSGEYSSTTRFKVQYRKVGGEYEDITTFLDSNVFSYSHSISAVYPHNSHSYRVAIYNSDSTVTGYTNEVYLSTVDITSPYDLTVNPVSTHEVELAWKYPDAAGAATIVERKAEGETEWTQVASLGKGVNQFRCVGLTLGKVYTFRVKAYFGPNAYSVPVQSTGVKTGDDDTLQLSATFVPPNYVLVSWSCSWSPNVTIDIERKSGNGDYVPVFSADWHQGSWTDTNVVLNGYYTYRIKVRSKLDPATVISWREVSVPCVILNSQFDLKAYGSSGKIDLTWKDNTSDEAGFELWRKTGRNGEWVKYGDFEKDTTSFTDRAVSPNTEYGYQIRSYNTNHEAYSAYSNEVWASTSASGILLPLEYTMVSSTSVRLHWRYTESDRSNVKIRLQRLSEPYAEWKTLHTIDADVNEYSDDTVTSYQKYYYRLEFTNDQNKSSTYSQEVAVIPGIPEAPSALKIEQLSPNSIRLIWVDKAMNEDGFIIERILPEYGGYVEVARTPADTVSYVEKGLLPGTIYYYRVKAFNKTGSSAYTKEESILPSKPKTFTDLSDVDWAKEAIENLSSRNVINGKTETLFFPNDSITRGEFVSLMIRSFGLSKTPVGYLADVKPADWYYKDIMTAKSLGILSDSNGYFFPTVPITREDMAVIVYKVLKAADKTIPAYDTALLEGYLDRDLAAPYALPYLAALKGEKIIDGKSSTLLAPKDPATRAEAVVMLYRIIDR